METQCQKAIYHIIGNINDESLLKFLEWIAEAEHEEIKKATVYIQSSGGSMPAGMAISERIMYSDIEIKTIGMGEVSSAAIFILCSGKPAYLYNNTYMFSHDIGYELEFDCHIGQKRTVSYMKKYKKIIASHIMQQRNITLRTANLLNRSNGLYLTSREAKNMGLIDGIIYR